MKVFNLQSARLSKFLRSSGMLLLGTGWLLTACAGGAAGPVAPAMQEAQQHLSLRSALAKDGESIDYDTLMDVYRKMVSSPAPIPQMEELLRELIDQRNADPRIDQMVLILAAHAIGNSQFPIPDVEALFERILDQEADRISYWVLAFVADAIGNYPLDLSGGDALVDRVQAWQSRLEGEAALEKEYFGTHFMPPPKSRTIQTHLAGISDQGTRQRERNAYYTLIMNDFSESQIVAAYDYLMHHGLPGSGEIPKYPLASLVGNWHLLPHSGDQEGEGAIFDQQQ
jgi:hypothetical protein